MPTKKLKFLFIDDDPDDILILKYHFEKTSFRSCDLFVQHDLNMPRNSKPDIVLLDLGLEETNSIQTVNLAKKTFPESIIIIISGNFELDFAKHYISLGIQDFLFKSSLTAELLERTISFALERTQFNQKLLKCSTMDELTQLKNRRYFSEQFNHLLTVSKRYKKSFGLLLIDIDDFKGINDTYGHLVGDQILVEFARRLRLLSRTSDLVTRLGGDEFAILLTQVASDQKLTHQSFEQRFKPLIETPYNVIVDNQMFHLEVKFSMGLAFYPDHGDNYEKIFLQADKNLYHLKSN